MKIIAWPELLARSENLPGRVAATIGVFDGIHVGHQKLIRAVTADSSRKMPVVLTFRSNPASILRPYLPTGNILSSRQKFAKLAALGVGALILIDFSHEFSTLTGRNFVQQLRSCLDLKKIVVGYNFHFGWNRDTDASGLTHMLEGSGIEVEVIPPTLYESEVVSSSRLRSAIREGRFNQASAMLAGDYTVDLLAVPEISRRGAEASIPRSALSQMLPKAGQYPALLLTDRGEMRTLVSVSTNALSWTVKDRHNMREIRFIEAE